ncbi:MAG: flagellar basal body P-ring formation protein FlgA [Betaproteobacteria bacterium]|nr:flagellar basal body P-ring formation protein FlgA [Betaproteobacteria bacterium]
MKRFLKLLAICVLGAGGGLARVEASASQAPAQIQQAIDQYLRVQTAGLPGTVTYTVGGIDPRVVLTACAAPEVFLPPGARLWGATNLGVRCTGAATWSIYVSVQVKVTGTYVVTARPLAQGLAVASSDISIQTGDLTQFPAGIVTDPQLPIGKTLAAALAAGQPLRQDLLRSPLVVQQGQNVKLQSSGHGFRVSADGKSLTNAADGQIAQVRTSSGQTVSGVARAGGIVEIIF